MFIWLILLLPLTAYAQQHQVVLVDCSGSMEGFFSTNAAQQIIGTLEEVPDQRALLRLGFINHSTIQLPADNKPSHFGSETLISKAFDRELARSQSSRIIWLLTDNIQSHEQASHDMQEFFAGLHRGDRINSVSIFPMLARFSGEKYDWKDKPIGLYTGSSGLLLYQIGLDGTPSIVSDSCRSKVSESLRQCFHVQDYPDEWRIDDAKIRPFETGSIDLIVQSSNSCQRIPGKRDTLRFTGIDPLEVNERISINFIFKPVSKLNDLVVREIEMLPAAGIPNRSDFLLDPSDIGLSCTPNRIYNVHQGEHIESVTTTLDIDNLRIHNSLTSWFRCFWTGSGWMRIPMEIEFHFPSDKILLDTSFISPFQSEIPHLNALAQEIYAKDNVVESKEFYVEVPVKYPLYPIILILLILIIGLALIAGMIVAYIRRGTWQISRSDDYHRQIRPLIVGYYPMAEVHIFFLLNTWKVKVRSGYELSEGSSDSYPVHVPVSFIVQRIVDEYDDLQDDSPIESDEDEVRYKIESLGRQQDADPATEDEFDSTISADDDWMSEEDDSDEL